jgi:hypothetical protein
MNACETCNTTLTNPKARFCSAKCRVQWHRAAKRPAEARNCAHCGKPVPADARQGTRFCRDACRVMHHQASIAPLESAHIASVHLSPLEAGLLLAAARPWWTAARERPAARTRHQPQPQPHESPAATDDESRERHLATKRAYNAARRLIALGLVRRGECAGALVIERTALGHQLVEARREALEATAITMGQPADDERYIYWRDAPRPKTPLKRAQAPAQRPENPLTPEFISALLAQQALW